MAQLVARFHGMEEVRGSNPLSSTHLLLSKVQSTLVRPPERAASVISGLGDAAEGIVELDAHLAGLGAQEDHGEDSLMCRIDHARRTPQPRACPSPTLRDADGR